MSHDPKLEIYRLKLSNKETGSRALFRDLFREILNYSGLPTPLSREDIFKTFFSDFIKQIDTIGYKKDDRKQKGFTIAFDTIDGKRKSLISSPLASDEIISGLLEGGKFGLKRNLGEVDNISSQTPISTRHIIGDRYYFLIYTPLDHNEGIVMIQGYTEAKISDVVRNHLLEYFRHPKKIDSKFEIYTPPSFKNKYLEKATFKSFKFTSGWVIKEDFDENVPDEYELEVRIELVDKSKKKLGYKKFKELIKAFGKGKFKPAGGVEKQLSEFPKKAAKMNSNNKDIPIDFDDEDNIKPVILLKDQNIAIREGGIPDFDQIDIYCRKLLAEIKEDILPTNGIKEL